MESMKKFNEFFYPEKDIESNQQDSNQYQITKEEMDKLEKLSKGQISEVKLNGFTISKPSEFDGKAFLIVNKEGKHQKIEFDGNYPSMAEAERKILDIISGKIILESKRHKGHK